MAILIVQNSPEGPGLLEDILCQHNIEYNIIDLEQGDDFPDPREYEAVVVLGGPDSANDQTPKMQRELSRIKEILDADIPYLGLCLGMQALAKAAGGEVYQSPVPEVGWRDPDGHPYTLRLTSAGRSDQLFSNVPSSFSVFQLHGETVRLAENIRLLAVGNPVEHQVIKVGAAAYGLQAHMELTPEMFECWRTQDSGLRILNQWQLQKDYGIMRAAHESNGRELFTNFLRIAKVLDAKPTNF